VVKVHVQGRRHAEQGHDVVLIGHAGHAEVEGTRGQIDGRLHLIARPEEVANLDIADPARVAYITQTTLGVQDTRDVIAALKARFPDIVGPDTRNICYATQNRQAAVQEMAGRAEVILVIGSRQSSNSSRLREIGAQLGVPAYLVEGPASIDLAWLEGVSTLGLSAGASAPEELIQATIDWLRHFRDVSITELEGVEEDVVFRLPVRLASTART
jgi:4-hydroxy-3-methylbut-2-enyl diphosphate reductase